MSSIFFLPSPRREISRLQRKSGGKRLEFVTGREEDASREKKLLIREVEDRVRPKNYELAGPPGV